METGLHSSNEYYTYIRMDMQLFDDHKGGNISVDCDQGMYLYVFNIDRKEDCGI